jgi:hypothetical protein
MTTRHHMVHAKVHTPDMRKVWALHDRAQLHPDANKALDGNLMGREVST